MLHIAHAPFPYFPSCTVRSNTEQPRCWSPNRNGYLSNAWPPQPQKQHLLLFWVLQRKEMLIISSLQLCLVWMMPRVSFPSLCLLSTRVHRFSTVSYKYGQQILVGGEEKLFFISSNLPVEMCKQTNSWVPSLLLYYHLVSNVLQR